MANSRKRVRLSLVIDFDSLEGKNVLKEQLAAIYYKSGWDVLVNSEAWENTSRWKKKISVGLHGSMDI